MISPIKKNGIILGYIDTENKIYISDRNRTHIFNIYNGLGISIKVLDLLQEKDINKIIIRMEGNELITTVSTFLVHGISYTDITQQGNKTGVQPSSNSSTGRSNKTIAPYENEYPVENIQEDKQLILPFEYFNKKQIEENQSCIN